MAENKKSFVLYVDILPSIKLLKDHEAGKLFIHILRYVNDEFDKTTEDPKNRTLNLAWQPIKKTLKADLEKYKNTCLRNQENGKKGGRPSKENKPKKPSGLSGIKNKPKKPDNDNDNDNDILKEKIYKRKTEFKKLLAEHQDNYPKQMIDEFYEYWTEHSPNDKKMRHEKQTSFDVSRRLKNWFKKSNGSYDNDDRIIIPD